MIPEPLREVAQQVHDNQDHASATVRQILSWFGAKRRGYHVVQSIRRDLEELRLRTDPDFELVYIDSKVDFFAEPPYSEHPAEEIVASPGEAAALESSAVQYVFGAIDDPTFRIGQLEAANRPPCFIVPDAALEEATTIMMMRDFSQLPVMQNEREVKGVVSWESIGRRRAIGRPCATVRECMDTTVPEAKAESSLFSAIELIVRHGYVLVRQPDRKVSGIVTTSDLSLQFRQLAEPFLLVGEIENYVRRLVDGRFTVEELREVLDPSDPRDISSVADLTFGDYVRLLENPGKWDSLAIPVHRAVFTKELDRIREVRNDVMHFDPDPFAEEDLQLLRNFVSFMRSLVSKSM